MKRMPGGDLLLIWNDTPPYDVSNPRREWVHKPRNPLRSVISKDDGESWENRRTIEDRHGYGNAYPSVTFVGRRGAGDLLRDRAVGTGHHERRGAAEDLSEQLVLPTGA